MFNGGSITYDLEVNSDGAVKSLQEFQKEWEAIEEYLESTQKTLSKDAQEYVKNIDYLQEKLSGLEAGTDEYNSTAKNLEQQLGYLKDSLGLVAEEAEEVEDKFSNLGTALSTIGFTALAGTVTAGTKALSSLANKGIQATSFLETARIGMAGLTGSIGAGNKALSVAADYWQNNPFNRFDVTNATKSLVQYGRDVSDLASDLQILGNVSLSTGTEIDTLAWAYGRVASKGKATTREIEMMANKGVPIYRELAKQLDTTQAGVRDLAAKGKVDFETFRKAMESSVNPEAMEQFENTLARQQDRLSGSISILAGDLAGYKIVNDQLVISNEGLYSSWTKLTKTLATGLRSEGLREGLTKLGEILADLVDKVIPVVEKGLEGLGKVIDFIGDNSELLVPIFGALALALGGLASKVPILGSLVKPIMNLITMNPGLTALIALLTVGFTNAYKSSETFRESLSKIFSGLSELVKKLIPIITSLAQVFMDFATSPVVQTGLELIVALIADLANLLSNIPTEGLAMIVGGLIALKASPVVLLATAFLLLYSHLKSVIESMGGLHQVLQNIGQGIKDFFTGIVNFIAQFNLVTIGQNFIRGFFDGAREAFNGGTSALYAGFQGLITGVMSIFGIHSPSTVMADIGKNLVLGLAEGINKNSSIVEKAMDRLATATLKTAEKVIGNRKDFGIINLNGVYKDWKKVSQLFAVGSEQYNSALEKMEEARKQVNLEIINLQKEYNDTLDNSIKKISKFYGIFDDVSTKGGKNATQIIKNLDKQVAQTAEWAEAQRIIAGLDLDPKFIEELKDLGVDSVSELSSIANMTTSELEQLNSLWLQKQSIATQAATEQLSGFKDETLQKISDLADGIDEETVNVRDVGGRLVADIAEGVTGALPTLESAMSQLGDYINQVKRELGETASGYGGAGKEGDYENPLENWANNLKADIEQFGKNVSGWLLAGVGVIAAVKFGPKIIGAITSGIKGGGALSKLGGLFGGKKTLGVGDSMDLSGLNKTTSALGETGSGLSKAGEISTTIAKAALAIAAIAVAIAAIAGSIWVMDNALAGIDWGTFISKLGMVAVATVAMGALAFAADKVGVSLAGILVIVGLAADIALVGLALGAMANSIPDDVGLVQIKMLLMYEAVVAMGALATLGGVIAGLAALGILVILGIAGDIAAVGLALGEMARSIPDDVGLVQKKIELMVKAVGSFEALTAIGGLLAPLEGLGILAVIGIAEDIKEVAKALFEMYLLVPKDLLGVEIKMEYIKHAIKSMSEANLGNLFGNIITSERIKAILPTVQSFTEIAQALSGINQVQTSSNGIDNVINGLQKIISAGEYVQQYAEAGQRMVEALVQGVSTQAGLLQQAGRDVQGQFWAGLEGKMADEYQQGVYLVKNVYDGGYSVIGTFVKLGNEVQSNFWHGVQNKMPDEYNQGRALGETLRQGMYDVDYANAGWWAVQGFINGASNRGYYSGGGSVYWVGYNIANEFLRGLKDRGEQGSPWKTTKESGVFAVEGLLEGIKSMESQVVSEAETLADGIVNALDLQDVSISPSLSVSSLVAPSSGFGEEYAMSGGRNIVINQSNVNYSEYDYEQSVRDLSYELSKI